jgi:hypothetical protein
LVLVASVFAPSAFTGAVLASLLLSPAAFVFSALATEACFFLLT